MNNSILQFELFCTELTKEEKETVDFYLNQFCPVGETSFYRNYFFRLYWLASRSKAKKIVELGARPGGSTIALMWAVNRNDGHLWSCDLADTPQILPHAAYMDLSRRSTISSMRANEFGMSWKNGEVDMIYLDASHSYQDTCEEIDAWLPHLKEGGMLVFHDTEIYKNDVMRAIFDRMMQSGKLFEFHHFPDCHGHGVLQWYGGTQTSTSMMRATNDSIVSLTSLLMNSK